MYSLNLLAGKAGIRRYIGPKRIIGLAALISVAFGARYLWHQGLLDPITIRGLVGLHPITSVAMFVAIYAASLMFGIPTLPLNLAAGVFWGALFGGLLSALATSAAAIGGFLAARLIFGQPLARRFGSQRLQWLQNSYEKHGWKVVAFTRLNPVFPTGVLNYLFGLTSIGVIPYSAATLGFILPPSIAVAWIGSAMGSFMLGSQGNMIWQGVLVLSAAVTLLFSIRLVTKLISIPVE